MEVHLLIPATTLQIPSDMATKSQHAERPRVIPVTARSEA